MIVNGSRYMGQPVVTVLNDPDEQAYAAAVYGPPPAPVVNFVYYTVVEGDRLDTIASDLYGIPDYWYKIAYANPEIFYPDNLVVGSIIRLPSQ
jgi:hypothetical protein